MLKPPRRQAQEPARQQRILMTTIGMSARGLIQLPQHHLSNISRVSSHLPYYTHSRLTGFKDPGIGNYSVRHTATDTVAWIDPSMGPSGSSEKCVAQGLCNPQFRFFKNGYDLVINSWQVTNPNGADSGGYSGQYVGICSAAQVLDQFSKGGDILGSQ